MMSSPLLFRVLGCVMITTFVQGLRVSDDNDVITTFVQGLRVSDANDVITTFV